MRVFSWNVNSLRSCELQFLDFVGNYSPDIIAIQELRAHEDQISFFLKTLPEYEFLFNDSGRPGYGGTALYYKSTLPIKQVTKSVGNEILDSEGRTIYTQVGDIQIYNFYTPNGNSSEERLKYKLNFYDEILNLSKRHIQEGNKFIIGGDLNVAATQKDVFFKNPRHSGFLIEEREWFQKMLEIGMFDTFRKFEKGTGFYSWWHFRDPKREQNKGWRFDYFLASKNLSDTVVDAGVEKEVFGSDHCPVWVELKND